MAEFELMSAELLGGAPLPPMTQQERQQYINGITIKAKVRPLREIRWRKRRGARRRTVRGVWADGGRTVHAKRGRASLAPHLFEPPPPFASKLCILNH